MNYARNKHFGFVLVFFFIFVIFALVDMNYEFICFKIFFQLIMISILCSFYKDMHFQNFYLLIK